MNAEFCSREKWHTRLLYKAGIHVWRGRSNADVIGVPRADLKGKFH